MSERNRLARLARQAVTGLRDLPGNVAWVVRKVADRRADQGAPAGEDGATAPTATAPAGRAAKAPATKARTAATGRPRKARTAAKARTGGAGSATKARKAAASGRDGDELAGLTRAELLRRARELDVAGRSSMSKAALAEAVRRAEAAR
jgi:hypothetical protein|nr:hypothetical protein [Thermoanaerobacterales bacterium]